MIDKAKELIGYIKNAYNQKLYGKYFEFTEDEVLILLAYIEYLEHEKGV